MNRWRFLPLCPDDLNEVAAIEVQSFNPPWERPAIKEELASLESRAFILRQANQASRAAVGAYIFLRILADDVHIMKVAVAHDWRREGLATRLTDQALGEARREGCRRAILEVRISNAAAIRLYSRLSFKKIGKRKRYYGPAGEDALVMAKNLKEVS